MGKTKGKKNKKRTGTAKVLCDLAESWTVKGSAEAADPTWQQNKAMETENHTWERILSKNPKSGTALVSPGQPQGAAQGRF